MSDFDDEPSVAADANDRPDADPDAASTAEEPAAEAEPVDAEPVEPAAAAAKPVADDDWDDDWDDDDDDGRGGGKRDLTLVYAIVAAAIVIVLAVVLTRPKDDNNNGNAQQNNGNGVTTTVTLPNKNWQGPVADAVGDQGKNAQKRAEAAPGVYIWTDFQGWHLRSNNTSEVTVTVAADQVRVKKTDDYDDGDESSDAAFATEQVVKLPAGDGKTGVGLDLGTSEQASFTVVMDGKNVAPASIKLGGAEGQADQNPITFNKA